jgi:hypothetical protein
MAELENVAVGIRDVAGDGHVVRLQVGNDFVHLEPTDAAELARRLTDNATEAIYADRADRRG